MRRAPLLTLLLFAPIAHAEDGQVLFRVKSLLTAFALSPDGKHAALATADKSVRLIDLPRGKEVRTFAGPAAALAFSPDGKTLAASGQGVKLWNVATGELAATWVKDDAGIASLSYRGDGKALAIGSPAGGARLLDVSNGSELAAFKLPHYGVTAVALSPDGKALAAGGNAQPDLPPPGLPPEPVFQVWSVETKRAVDGGTWPMQGGLIQFSPAGIVPLVTSGAKGDGPVIWYVRELRPGPNNNERLDGTPLSAHLADPTALAFSPNGQLIASACARGVILFRDPKLGPQPMFTRRVAGAVRGLGFTPGAKALISAEVTFDGETILRSFDPADDRPAFMFLPLTQEPIALAVSRDGIIEVADPLQVVGKEMKLDRPVWFLTEHPFFSRKPKDPSPELDSVAFSPDGKTIVTLDRASTLRVWALDADSRRSTLTTKRLKVGRFVIALSPDAKTIAVEAGNDVTVLDAKGEERFTLTSHRKAITALAFTPDGKTLISAAQDRKVKWWDAAAGKSLGEAEHSAAATSLAVSPDGKHVAAGGEDGTVLVWDAATRDETARLSGHSKSVRGLAFSPDGNTLASGSADGLLILWDVGEKKERVKIANAGGPMCVAFTPDGKTLLSAGESRLVQFWDAATGREKSRP